MKKRFSALFLALVMCLGLAVPAFAADSEVPEGSYTVDLDKPDPTEMGVDGEYMVRYLNTSRSYDEATSRVDATRILPQGSEFTWTGLRSSHNVYFRFFTDLDKDGTYDERLVVKESGKNVLAPYEEKYASSLTQVSGKSQSAGTFATMVEEMGGKLEKDSSSVMTLSISSDSLCEFFDGATLFEWGVMKNGSTVVIKGTMLFTAEAKPEETDKPDETDKPEDPEPTAPAFTDVEEGAYYEDAVKWAVAHTPAVTNGTSETTFEPDATCTQLQILTFLYRAAQDKGEASAIDLISAGKWAMGKGIIGEDFDENKDCTRATAVSYIWQAFDKPEADKSEFKDVAEDADYAAAVDWAVANGITNGTDLEAGEFSPDDTCTRGQIVTFLHRAYVEEARLNAEK